MKQLLIVVEDDKSLNQGLCKALAAENLQVISCQNIRSAREQLLLESASLVLLDALPNQLSGGQQQRVAIARALASVAVSFVLALILNPLAGNLMEDMFWFYNAQHFSFIPILAVIPVFAFLGWFVPTILYGQTTKRSVVERLRETE